MRLSNYLPDTRSRLADTEDARVRGGRSKDSMRKWDYNDDQGMTFKTPTDTFTIKPNGTVIMCVAYKSTRSQQTANVARYWTKGYFLRHVVLFCFYYFVCSSIIDPFTYSQINNIVSRVTWLEKNKTIISNL